MMESTYSIGSMCNTYISNSYFFLYAHAFPFQLVIYGIMWHLCLCRISVSRVRRAYGYAKSNRTFG